MRSLVAVVETQPATIGQDYERVLSLAKLSGLVKQRTAQDPLSVLVDVGSGSFQPGYSATPWQVAAVLAHLSGDAKAVQVAAVSARGVGELEGEFLPRENEEEAGFEKAVAQYLRLHRHVSTSLHPALDEALTGGVQLPVGLAQNPGLLLSSPTSCSGWGLAGAVAMLQSIIMAGAKVPRQTPVAEVAAESLAVALEAMPQVGAVLDGTLWGVDHGQGKRMCVARNVLIAGQDPLAVDVVALRLAGADPQQLPWVRLCQERGVGTSRASEITVVGRTDLLDLDFELGNGTFGATPPPAWTALTGKIQAGWSSLSKRTGQGAAEGRFTDTIWAEYYAADAKREAGK